MRAGPPGPRITTIFFGGGTPTTMAVSLLDEVLGALHQVTAADAPAEFTVEANPATVDAHKAAVMCARGVNRVSLGAQSFHETELAFLERLHDPAAIPVAVANLRAGGISNINLDLIFGIPGQTLASWQASLQRALDLEPEHLACYGLTYEPNTALTVRLRQGRIERCDEGLEAEMYLLAVDLLAVAGFEHYEISNFARPGRRCAHNLIYWRNQPYLAIGPSAAGFTGAERYKNIAQHGEYVRRIEAGIDPAIEHEQTTPVQAAMETLMMGLRLLEGIDLVEFARGTGFDLRESAYRHLETLCRQGMVAIAAGRLHLTRSGLLVADGIIAELAGVLDDRPGVSLPVVQTRRN